MSHLKIEEKKSKSYGDPYSEEFDVGAGFQVFVECWGDCLKPLVRQIDDGPKAVKRTVRLKKKEEGNHDLRLFIAQHCKHSLVTCRNSRCSFPFG